MVLVGASFPDAKAQVAAEVTCEPRTLLKTTNDFQLWKLLKGREVELATFRFPAKSGAACAGDAPSATAVTAAASGRIGDFATTGPYQRCSGWIPQQGNWRSEATLRDRPHQCPTIVRGQQAVAEILEVLLTDGSLASTGRGAN